MGAEHSSHLKRSSSVDSVDWIGPSTSHKNHVKKSRLTSVFFNKCVGSKISRLNSRRKSRPASRDIRRAFRELISSWSCAELNALCAEMESGWAVKDLVDLADSARPSVSNLSRDLLDALNNHIATDCFVVFKGMKYALHSAVLCSRSKYMAAVKESSRDWSKDCDRLQFPDENIGSEVFFAALHYLYSGEVPSSLPGTQRHALQNLLERLGSNSSVENDFVDYDFEKNGDCTLVFTTNSKSQLAGASCSTSPLVPDYRLRCSSAIVAARSAFLRSLIIKKRRVGEPLEIVIDEHLIPRIYAPVILRAIYTDHLDLSKVLDGCQVSANSLNEVQAIASGRRQRTPLRHAIEIYHIAVFLNLSRLARLCEDVLMAELSMDTVVALWLWASEVGGSPYIRRQCVGFLRSEFSRMCSSHLLFELDEDFLHECLTSDFVQCSEVEILESLVCWGEHELVKRMEDREPNLVANTTHSISRRGVRRSDLNDQELKHILSNLLPLVRTDYILPPFHQSLNNAYKRGLLGRSPNADLLGRKYPDSRSPDVNPDAHWFDNTVPRRHPSGPRILVPYVNEAKTQLRKLCGSGTEVVSAGRRSDRVRFPSEISRIQVVSRSSEILDDETRAVVETRIIQLLRNDSLVKRAFSCCCDYHRNQAFEQVCLRVLREMNIDEKGIRVICPLLHASNRSSYVPKHYSSQPALAFSAVWPDFSMRPSSSQSDYDNENNDFLPDVVCLDPFI